MKKLAISILCLSLALPVLAGKHSEEETPKLSKGAIIEEDLKIENKMNAYKIYGSLKDIDKTKSDKMRLQGQVYVSKCKDKSLQGHNIANIQWLAVQKTDSPDKVVGFKEPIVSSFIFKDGTDIKNIPLPTFGDQKDLKRAISDLEQDKIDAEDLKRKRKFKSVYGRPNENSSWLINNRKAKKVIATGNAKGSNIAEFGETAEMTLDNKDLSKNSSDKASKDGGRSSVGDGSSGFGSFNSGESNNLPGFQSNGGTHRDKEKSADNKSNDSNNKPKERTIYKNASGYDLYRLDRIDEDNPPHIEGNAVVVAKDAKGKQRAYFVRNGQFVRNKNGKLASKEVDVNVDNLTVDEKGKVIKNNENKEYIDNLINELMFDFNKNAGDEENEPIDFGAEVRIELTEEGCNPEHEVLQERVIITSRAKKIEDDKVIDEGVCERTLESYPVKRDYLCEECVDEVDLEGKRAFARYQEHWFDKEGTRHNLGIKVNEGEPFQIFEESKGCGFEIDEDEMVAIEKRKLGYLNKFKVFKTVESCRVTEHSARFPVKSTAKDCPVIHDFIENKSYEQRKLVFKKNDREYEAKACHVFGAAIGHILVRECCPSILNPIDNSVTQPFKREVVISQGFLDRQSQFQHQTITDYCELPENTTLQAEWCPDEYVHDIILGRSYFRKRYYYLAGHDKKYVTNCLRTNDYVVHQTEPMEEWEHNDQKKCSYPKIKHFFDAPEPVNERKIIGINANSDAKEDYVLVENVQRPTGEHYYHGCFKRRKTNSINIFRRPDNTTFEENLGVGEPIISEVNECTETHEERTQGNVRQRRTVTTYPGGRQEYGQWVAQ